MASHNESNTGAPDHKDDYGYYMTLGLPLNGTDEDIKKAYKRLALRFHPDKNQSDPDATTKFQKIVTAYAVLNDAKARGNYLHVLRMRYYASQPHDESTLLGEDGLAAPFYIFSVVKRNIRNQMQERLIKLDLVEKTFQNWNKDDLKTSFNFSDIESIAAGSGEEDFVVQFKSRSPYPYKCMFPSQRDLIVRIVHGVLTNSLPIRVDDSFVPAKSIRKGIVQKKCKTPGLGAGRWVTLGERELLISRDRSVFQLVNIVPMIPALVQVSREEPMFFSVHSPRKKFSFRLFEEEDCSAWFEDVTKVLRRNQTEPTSEVSVHGDSTVPYDDDDVNEVELLEEALQDVERTIHDLDLQLQAAEERREAIVSRLEKARQEEDHDGALSPSSSPRRTASRLSEYVVEAEDGTTLVNAENVRKYERTSQRISMIYSTTPQDIV